ncbi:MAG: DUF3095 domain-containing protein [Candidatus Marinimicrobia bacterium]|nr:DUF3095 domain-containing protein [Candidatus Neomarinimicrobiota bacterium]MCF7851566.1 DUF3095 domain-containing protein [Candidatus Neomarinimicrobiota bacterium]MCF7904686.1 DUF3095 domain-containing protein [Candidatus Neomarinimicrobiota bacterium]
MSEASRDFYAGLTSFSRFHDCQDLSIYKPLPDDWDIAVTDVVGSTRAIDDGRYKEVNGVGVASIVAILNAVAPTDIPYVFGGDGVVACFPKERRSEVKANLLATAAMARHDFELDLRIGIVPMNILKEAGHSVRVGKFKPHNDFDQAMFMGAGLTHAEELVKGSDDFLLQGEHLLKPEIFEGFECRWSEIPSEQGEHIALIVQAQRGVAEEQELYKHVLEHIQRIYGDEQMHRPLHPKRMRLTPSPRRLSVEARVRQPMESKKVRRRYLRRLQFLRLAGIWLMFRKAASEHSDWGAYKSNLVQNTDYRKFDNALRMVIAGTPAQRYALREVLETLRAEGRLVYGIHHASNALITCIVKDYKKDHVHFLDASGGGYALAARELKRQLTDLATNEQD